MAACALPAAAFSWPMAAAGWIRWLPHSAPIPTRSCIRLAMTRPRSPNCAGARSSEGAVQTLIARTAISISAEKTRVGREFFYHFRQVVVRSRDRDISTLTVQLRRIDGSLLLGLLRGRRSNGRDQRVLHFR